MPRKTIAALEAYIAELQQDNRKLEDNRDYWKQECERLNAMHGSNVFLAYQPSGDSEVDAIQVAARAIDSLPALEARARCGAYLEERFRLPPKED